MAGRTTPPEGYHTVTPYLVVADVLELIAFMTKAFGATEMNRNLRPDGRVAHAEVRLGDSVVMMGTPAEAGTPMPATIHLYVDNADATYERAIEAGAQSLREPGDQPYGDRMAGVVDRFGNQWWIATPITAAAEAQR